MRHDTGDGIILNPHFKAWATRLGMFRKHDDHIHLKRALPPHVPKGITQRAGVLGQEAAGAVLQDEREEETTAGDLCTNVVGHDASLVESCSGIRRVTRLRR